MNTITTTPTESEVRLKAKQNGLVLLKVQVTDLEHPPRITYVLSSPENIILGEGLGTSLENINEFLGR